MRQFIILLLLLGGFANPVGAAISTPEDFLGKPIGADRQLVDHGAMLSYLEYLAAESPRVELVEIGKSTLGRPFVVMRVADEAGLADLGENRKRLGKLLAADRIEETTARKLAKESRPVLAFSMGLHSNEVGASQAAMKILHALATREDELTRRIRAELIVMMVPSMNPDGMDIVNQWYMETVGTEAEGTLPPQLYHHYAGHDNNRDGFFNNLSETAAWSKLLYHDALPQVIIDEHQMGSSGPRLFLPPFDDPLSPSVHPLVFSQLFAAGQQVVSDLHAEGWSGIATGTIFTAEWPGSVRSTGFWHNMLGILSEVASARLATPLHFPPGSLRPSGRGLPEYERRANFLEPWDGGWWRLGDIVRLEEDLTFGFLRWAVERSDDLLLNFWRMNRDAIALGQNEAPYGFIMPLDQRDPGRVWRLAELLQDGGLEVRRISGSFELEGRLYAEGALVVDAAQAFRPFLMEMLHSPPYPMVRDGGGKLIRPYDVTAWSLPDLLGVDLHPLERVASRKILESAAILESPQAASARIPEGSLLRAPAATLASTALVNRILASGGKAWREADGDFLLEAPTGGFRPDWFEGFPLPLSQASSKASAREQAPLRLGIYEPWGGSRDGGWTRLILDRYGFQHEEVRAAALSTTRSGEGRKLASRLDALIIPSISSRILSEGRYSNEAQVSPGGARWPMRYRGGMGQTHSGQRLREFVEAGGHLIAMGESLGWVIEALDLPVNQRGGSLSAEEYAAPGTLLRATVDRSHPLARGMGEEVALYVAGDDPLGMRGSALAIETPLRFATADRLAVAGFLVGAEELAGRPALLDIPLGKGRVILFGFRPQRRAQTEATFPLLFNALLRASEG